MANNAWGVTLISAQIAGTALSASTTPTSLLPGAARLNFPSNYWAIGTHFKVVASGQISTAAAAPGTLTLDFRVGGTVVFNGGATGTLATSATNLTWVWEFHLTCRSIGNGTGATVIGTGILTSAALSAATPIFLTPASAPATGTGFDSTASNYLDLFATWSVNSASNSIQLLQYGCSMMN